MQSLNADVALFPNHCSYAGKRVYTGQACRCMISPSAFLQYSTREELYCLKGIKIKLWLLHKLCVFQQLQNSWHPMGHDTAESGA